ncbi:MAG TPA: hypothetical protein VMU94_04415 [Streptosporangiaceae bacterium]|nr:hypothetical protein [Streptosporangiaceae bacterium]
MSDENSGGAVIRWWAMLVAGAGAGLLIAWLGRVSGVPLRTVLSIAAGVVAPPAIRWATTSPAPSCCPRRSGQPPPT